MSGLQHFLRKTRIKLTALLNKIAARDPPVFPAWEVLRMATIEGARAVGLGDEVGSLEAPVRVPTAGRPAKPDLCDGRWTAM